MRASVALALALCAGAPPRAIAATPDPRIAARVMTLTRDMPWAQTGAVKLRFRTFHPQGLVKVGDAFFLSAVEVRTPPKRLAVPQDGHDRDTGAGIGHLFKFNRQGELQADLILGEGAIYHPGGLDFDGKSIWVPVAEYRPDSRSRIYRVDPATMRADLVFSFADHVGALACDPQAHELHGVSWGSRRIYAWSLGRKGVPIGAPRVTRNPEHYIDYQDCHSVSGRRMLCAGVAKYASSPNGPALELGGLDLIDLRDHRILWQTPVPLWSPSGRAMTTNPFAVEAAGRGLRAYFVPDDDDSTLFVFEAGGGG